MLFSFSQDEEDDWCSAVDCMDDVECPDVETPETHIGEDDFEECEERIEDGGGLFSTANWAVSAHDRDWFCELREMWRVRIGYWNLEDRLKAGFVKGSGGVLSAEELQAVRQDAVDFLAKRGIKVSDQVSGGQPFALDIMRGLLSLCRDRDQILPRILEKGISTGVWEEIPPSGVFAREDRQASDWTDIRSCEKNWPSAEKEEEKVAELLENEVQQGWVERWQGTWQDAIARWGERAVCGKLAIIQMEGKDDRLVGDSSACGASPNARFPERVRHPRAKDIELGMAVCHSVERKDGEPWAAIVMDVSAAHKRLKMSEADAGMAFFRCMGVLYRYVVAHFGAAWSAWWWSRTAAAIIRLVHVFLGAGHLGFVYVDDFLFMVKKKDAWHTACLLAVFFSCLGVPLSWHKLYVGQQVRYLGLLLDMVVCSIGLCHEKLRNFCAFLGQLVKGAKIDKKAFQKSVGKLQWAVVIAPPLRPWMSAFYRNLNAPGLAWLTGSPEVIHDTLNSLSQEGTTQWDVPGTGVRAGMQLRFVGRSSAGEASRWRGWWPARRSSLGFITWTKRRLVISRESHAVARMWEKVLRESPATVCRIKPVHPSSAAADAWAAGDVASIGGWWQYRGVTFWFRQEITREELSAKLSLSADLGSDIAFFECVAQVALVWLRCCEGEDLRGCRLAQVCDNEGVVWAAKKGMSTTEPLCFALQALAFWEHRFQVQARISHIPGEDNVMADALSRWKDRSKGKHLACLDAANERCVDMSRILAPVASEHP